MGTIDPPDVRDFVAGRGTDLLCFAYLLTGDARLADEVLVTGLARAVLAWRGADGSADWEVVARREIAAALLAMVPRREQISVRPGDPIERPDQEADGRGPDAPEADEPEADEPQADESEADAPEADESEAGWRALGALPPRHRAVLVLRHDGHLSDAEIAELLRCRRGTVRSMATAARSALADAGTPAALAEILSDRRRRLPPDPQLFPRVTALAAILRRRWVRRRALGVAAALAVLVVLVGLGAAAVTGGHPGRRGVVSGKPVSQTVPAKIGAGTVVDVAADPAVRSLYVLESVPAALYAVNPSGVRVTARAAVPSAMIRSARLAVGEFPVVWVWQPNGAVAAYDVGTLRPLYRLTVPAPVRSATALGRYLWLGTTDGVYRIGRPGGVTRIHGINGTVSSVAASPELHLILATMPVVGDGRHRGTRLATVDPDSLTGRAITTALLDVTRESVAVLAGWIWIAGITADGTPTLSRLDNETYQPVRTSPITRHLDRGTTVTAGQTVLWVRQGAAPVIYCIHPKTGRLLQQWRAAQGPVASFPVVDLETGDHIGTAISGGDLTGSPDANTTRLILRPGACTG